MRALEWAFNASVPSGRASHNMPSTKLKPEKISEYLEKELAQGRTIGPYLSHGGPTWTSTGSASSQKGTTLGNTASLLTCHSPRGARVGVSMTTSVKPCLYRRTSHQVEEVAHRLGRGALLAKMDIELAYRLIPVHPQDRTLHTHISPPRQHHLGV